MDLSNAKAKNSIVLNAAFWLASAILACASTSLAQAMDVVSIPSSRGPLQAYVFQPKGQPSGPRPFVIALHGCGGLKNSSGDISERFLDWADRLNAKGFTVVFPDSFGSRGLGSQCSVRSRTIRARERAHDVKDTADWLATQPNVDLNKVYLLGWSNGGSTALHAVWHDKPDRFDYRAVAIFYPGCKGLAQEGWFARRPTTIFHGLSDDWTPIGPCRDLATQANVKLVTYPGAYHGFDHPNQPIRERPAAFTTRSDGKVTQGTDPAARADAIARVMDLFKP